MEKQFPKVHIILSEPTAAPTQAASTKAFQSSPTANITSKSEGGLGGK